MQPARITLVLGGARSGKSAHAERLIESSPGPWTYLATAQAWDDEMRARIALHRERRSAEWITRDVPIDLPQAIRAAHGPTLVDCLTLWLTNVMLAEADLPAAVTALLDACATAQGPLVLVGNEVGLGIVPDNALARRFRDEAGRLHHRLAAEADRVVFMVAGLPMTVKPSAENLGAPRMSLDEDARHREKMAKRKAAQDAEVAEKTIEKGLLIVHTGPGKGKTTAALGLMLRALGRGWRVGVVQFIKGAWDTGEKHALKAFGDRIDWHTLGEGFTWETQDKTRDIAAAEHAWAEAQRLMADESIRLVILDELNIALRYDYLDLDAVVATLTARRPDLHVVVTGRNAKPALIEAADLVTEMGNVKHHFSAGVKAQEGIEF